MSKPESQFTVRPRNRRGPPQQPSNPAYPDGVHIQGAVPGARSCTVDLPYPAPERLIWDVRCKRCGYRLAVTAAGRPDDPRSLTLPCQPSA